MAKRIMIQGTMSGVGKSVLTAALCRIFRRDGARVAPFKSQNMALNSFVTADGREMGRAQVLQARAAGITPDVRMNPILLKPSSDVGSQLIVNGEVRGYYRASDYFRMKKTLLPEILAAYHSLEAENDIIVIEGAGSPAEINLQEDDIVNMGLAELVDAPVLLTGDINPGGVFAQLYGTAALLEKRHRQRIAGTIINKFRGDIGILRPGLEMLEERMGIPVLGVVPYLRLDLDEEDSLSSRLEDAARNSFVLRRRETGGKDETETTGAGEWMEPADVAVIRLPHISNYTDFAPIERHPLMKLRYVYQPAQLGTPDLLILPGTKNTMGDLAWLRERGLADAISRLGKDNVPILGICGGYQMLGERLIDPDGTEGERNARMRGLGLLPVDTVFAADKVMAQTKAKGLADPVAGAPLQGYQIHMGRTLRWEDRPEDMASVFCVLEDGKKEGTVCGQVFGTYLHGLFDTGEAVDALAAWLHQRKEKDSGTRQSVGRRPLSYQPSQNRSDWLETQLDLLADTVSESLDIAAIYRIMNETDERN